MKHPLEAFASSLDLGSSRVANFPSIIFLCGGPIGAPDKGALSFRALFFRRLAQEFPTLSKHVRLAEEANEWSKTSKHYNNLIELESDIAHLCALILLFVEGAGSIAELGAFSQVTPLREKLVAVLDRSYEEDDSFIQNGPISIMRGYSPDSVIFRSWLSSKDQCEAGRLDEITAKASADLMLNWLSEHLLGFAKEEKFCINDHTHRLLLIADSINLGTIMLKGEIIASLKALGMNIATQELEKSLFLLEKLHLIDAMQFGPSTYYMAAPEGSWYIKFAHKQSGKAWDRQQVKFDLRKPLLRDSKRKKAWKQYLEGR